MALEQKQSGQWVAHISCHLQIKSVCQRLNHRSAKPSELVLFFQVSVRCDRLGGHNHRKLKQRISVNPETNHSS